MTSSQNLKNRVRRDMSRVLVHWTKGTEDEAYATLRIIIREGVLRAGTGFIRGATPCICFSEAPMRSFHEYPQPNYKPFGVFFLKEHIFALGGRPVIYSTDAELRQFPMQSEWRHVRYEPNSHSPAHQRDGGRGG